MGIANRAEYDWQSMASHGAAALLPASASYTVAFDYDLYTWDSYQPSTLSYKGYWDSFSVSVSGQPYWQSSHTDPVTPGSLPGLGFITGGSTWGLGILQHYSGSETAVVAGNPSGTNYLSVILDTATLPSADNAYPSWGTITIKDVMTGGGSPALGSQAADLARSVVGGPYGWGGKGWDWEAEKYVEPQVIQNGTEYPYYILAEKKVVLARGVDCAGLVYWSYDKAAGSTKYYGNPVYYENALTQCSDVQSDAVANASDLRPGDILCFSYNGPSVDHVAMYVGGSDPNRNVVEAGGSGGDHIVYASLATRTNSTSSFSFFRRIKPAIVPLTIQTHSPISLIVADPDGFAVDTDTLTSTGGEYIRGIPGVLYYGTDGNLDDLVYAPILKTGVYTIRVVPKPDALPTDVFSLNVTAAAKFVELAHSVSIIQIPSEGFDILSTGEEIVPVLPTLIGNALTILKQGHGVVTSTPGVVDCGSVCTGWLLSGTPVTLTASADPGWTFAGWSGDITNVNAVITHTITANTAVTATFTQDQYALAVTIVGKGDVDIDPDQATYIYGNVITLTASADPGWAFAGWSGDVDSTENALALTMDADKTVTATFGLKTYIITPTVGAGGLITPSMPQTVHHGDDITFTIAASTGYHIADVVVDGISQGAISSYTFSDVTADHTISVAFALSAPPGITSGDRTTFVVGTAEAFTVRATGAPTPTILLSGTLPDGVTFTDNGDGTATLSGTPTANAWGMYALTFSASNGVAPDAVQAFTLMVNTKVYLPLVLR